MRLFIPVRCASLAGGGVQAPSITGSNVNLNVPRWSNRVKLSPKQQTLVDGQSADASRRNPNSSASNSAAYDVEGSIRSSTSVGKLLTIMERHGARMERVHVHAMFVRAGKLLAHMSRLQQRYFNRQFKPVPTRRVNLPAPAHQLPARTLTPAGPQPSQRSTETASTSSAPTANMTGSTPMRKRLASATAPPASAAGRRRSVMRLQPGSPLMLKLMQQLLSKAEPYLQNPTPAEAAHIVFALAMCTPSLRPTQQLDVLLAATQSSLTTFPGDCLAKMVWGLGVMGLKPDQAWLQALDAACMAHSSNMGAHRSSVLLLAGLAGLRHTIDLQLLYDITANLQPRLDWLTPHDMATLMVSLATLGCAPSPAFLHQYLMRSSSKLSGMSPSMLAQLAGALARLRYVPAAPWARKFFHYSHRALGVSSVEEVVAVGHAMARLNITPPRAWLHDAMCLIRGLPLPVGAGKVRVKQSRKSKWFQAQALKARNITAVAAGSGAGSVSSSRWYKVPSTPTAAQQAGGGAAGQGVRVQLRKPGPLSALPRVSGNGLRALRSASASVACGEGQVPIRAPAVLRPSTDSVDGGSITALAPSHSSASSSSSTLAAAAADTTGISSTPTSTSAVQTGGAAAAAHPLPVWRSGSELTPSQALRVSYLVSKCKGDPAMTRHVRWARNTLLPQLVRQLGDVGKVGSSAAGRSRRNRGTHAQVTSVQLQAAAAPAPQASESADAEELPHTYGNPRQQVMISRNVQDHCRPVQQAVDLLYACAELHVPLPAKADRARLLATLGVHMTSFTASHCTNVMVCLAVLKLVPEAQWAARFFDRVTSCLTDMRASELASILTASAYLGLDPGPEVAARVLQHVDGLGLTELAELVRKLDGSKVAAEAGWLAALRTAVKKSFAQRV